LLIHDDHQTSALCVRNIAATRQIMIARFCAIDGKFQRNLPPAADSVPVGYPCHAYVQPGHLFLKNTSGESPFGFLGNFREQHTHAYCQASSSRNMSAVDTSSEWIDITGDGGVLKKILKVGAGQ
jgi:hypothetical protein